MIFNWYENSKHIHETKMLTQNDGQDLKGQHSQEISYVRYLMSLGKSKKEMFEDFKSIQNGSASLFEGQPEEQYTLFKTRYAKAKKLGAYTEEDHLDNNVTIYSSEIDYLNSLEAPLWVRQYWLGILVWYKTIKNKYTIVIKDIKWNSWILSQCKNNYKYKEKSKILSKWNRDCNFVLKTNIFHYDNKRGGYKYKATGISVLLTWCKNQGNIAKENITLENFTELFNLLLPATFKCKECGCLYDIDKLSGAHNSLHLCDECKKIHYNQYHAKKMRLKRQNN